MGVHFDTQFRNPLAYPAGYKPGFDPSHPAGRLVRGSFVSVPGNMMSILKGNIGVVTGAPTNTITQHLGLATRYTTGQYSLHAGYSTVDDTDYTFGVTCIFEAVTGNQFIMTNSDGGTGASIFMNNSSSSLSSGAWAVTNQTSFISLVANVPYFLALSQNGTGNTNYIIKRLDTGKLITATSIGNNPGAPSGTVGFGNGNNFGVSNNLLGSVATGMWSSSYMSMQELVQWSADPWSFWYPNPGNNYFGVSASGFPWWGVQNNNFVIGTGVQ